MNQEEKRKLENQLLVMGLSRMNDPELIQQLADLVSNWQGDKHDFFQDLLNECDANRRAEMYNAMAPKLRFKALPLSQYEMRISERAGKMVSQGKMRVEGQAPRPINVGNQKYAEVDQEHATHAMLTLHCYKCTFYERFLGETPVGAMIEGRKAGWIRDQVRNKEVCPKCVDKYGLVEHTN